MKNSWLVIAVLVVLLIILSVVKIEVIAEKNITAKKPYIVQEVKYYDEIAEVKKPFGLRECKEAVYEHETYFNYSYEAINNSFYNFCRLYVRNMEDEPGNFTYYLTITYEDGRAYDYGDMTCEIKANSEGIFEWSQMVNLREPITCSFKIKEIPKIHKCEYPDGQYITVKEVVRKNRTVNATEYMESTELANVTEKISLIKWLI